MRSKDGLAQHGYEARLLGLAAWIVLALVIVASGCAIKTDGGEDDAIDGADRTEDAAAVLSLRAALLDSPELALLDDALLAFDCVIEPSTLILEVLREPRSMIGDRDVALAGLSASCPGGQSAPIYGAVGDGSIVAELTAILPPADAAGSHDLNTLVVIDGSVVDMSLAEVDARAEREMTRLLDAMMTTIGDGGSVLGDDGDVGGAAAALRSCNDRMSPTDFVRDAAHGDDVGCDASCRQCQALVATFDTDMRASNTDYKKRRDGWAMVTNTATAIALTSRAIGLACASATLSVVLALPGAVCAAGNGLVSFFAGVVSFFGHFKQRQIGKMVKVADDIGQHVGHWGESSVVGYQSVCAAWGFCSQQPRCTGEGTPVACLPWSYDVGGDAYAGPEIPPCNCAAIDEHPLGGACRMDGEGIFRCAPNQGPSL